MGIRKHHTGGYQNRGGTNVYVEDMVRRLAATGEEALILEANADNRGFATIRNLTLGTKSVYGLPADKEALIADLRGCGVWHIHFHQIMGGAGWAALPAQLGCPYDVTVHDYAFFCPRIDLIDEAGRYCGEPNVEVCERCVSLNLPHPDLRDAYRDRGGTMTTWLGLHRRLVTGARLAYEARTGASSGDPPPGLAGARARRGDRRDRHEQGQRTAARLRP